MDAVTSLTLKTGGFVQVYLPAALQTQHLNDDQCSKHKHCQACKAMLPCSFLTSVSMCNCQCMHLVQNDAKVCCGGLKCGNKAIPSHNAARVVTVCVQSVWGSMSLYGMHDSANHMHRSLAANLESCFRCIWSSYW